VITCLASSERWWITGRASSSKTSSGTIAGLAGVMFSSLNGPSLNGVSQDDVEARTQLSEKTQDGKV